MSMRITPIDATFGAVITGIDLGQLDDATWAAVHAAFLEYGVLVFPEQHLSEEAQESFARRLGSAEMLSPRQSGHTLICGWADQGAHSSRLASSARLARTPGVARVVATEAECCRAAERLTHGRGSDSLASSFTPPRTSARFCRHVVTARRRDGWHN
jgi:alpha-ketoglutarate-dependent taurine dioxygenase